MSQMSLGRAQSPSFRGLIFGSFPFPGHPHPSPRVPEGQGNGGERDFTAWG